MKAFAIGSGQHRILSTFPTYKRDKLTGQEGVAFSLFVLED